MRHRRLQFAAVAGIGFSLAASLDHEVSAAVSYTTPGATYTQDFNSLPNTPENVNLESGATPKEWIDDTAAPAANQISIPGWYLYHVASPANENGANGHQRMRIGAGTANTGAFMSWGSSAATERGLGNLTSNTIGDSFYGVRLTNNTGTALGQLTLGYTAEQWRDGGMTPSTAPSVAQSVTFGYAITTSTPTNIGTFNATTNPGGITGAVSVGSAGFTSPIFGATTATALDGNAAANRVAKSVTFGGFDWQPGQDLWLRWSDIDHANNDHGLGIDDLTFSANVAVNVFSVASGSAFDASTWSDNQPAGPVKNYHVVDGHMITLNAAFPGDLLSIENGSVDITTGGNGETFPLISVEPGGNLTESVVGDFQLGTGSSSLRVNRDLNFTIDPASTFTLAADLTGTGNLNFESGAGSELILRRPGGHQGTIRFNGTGDAVRLEGPENYNVLEMNSTGANLLSYESTSGGQILGNRVIFNQAGTLDHATNNSRTQGPFTLVANAPVTVDLTKTFPSDAAATDERRLLIGDDAGRLEGSADITVNGTVAPPSGGNITKNEFELGGTSPEPTTQITDSYSGTITGNNYVDFEIRHNLPNARFVINANSRLEMGHQVVGSTKTIEIGDVQINNGGTLEVGFEQGSATNDGHHAYHLTLTSAGSRDGNLTLADGSTTVMQINGPPASPEQFDRITAQGDVMLNGTLNLLINPVASSGTNPTYSPTIGDKFDIITIAPSTAPGDYDLNGTVGPEDYTLWRAGFGNTVSAGSGADGNGNGVVDAADYVVWREHEGQMGGLVGAITGTFDAVNIINPISGFNFQVNYSPTLVQLEVVAAGSGSLSAVPEASTLTSAGVLLSLLAIGRRRGFVRRLASQD